MERSDHRADPQDRDLRTPGARRRRGLAILALAKMGFDAADMAVWFDLSPRRVNQIRSRAERFAQAVGRG